MRKTLQIVACAMALAGCDQPLLPSDGGYMHDAATVEADAGPIEPASDAGPPDAAAELDAGSRVVVEDACWLLDPTGIECLDDEGERLLPGACPWPAGGPHDCDRERLEACVEAVAAVTSCDDLLDAIVEGCDPEACR